MHEYVLWVCLMAYGVHMIEETLLDWNGWVRHVLHLNAKWSEFYLVNGIVVVLGIGSAMVGWKAPAVGLIFPAFMVFNAIAFHILPVLVTRQFSPGIITSLSFFLPVGTWTYVEAARDGATPIGAVILSSALGVMLMLFPIVLQKVKSKPFFDQNASSAASATSNREARVASPAGL